MAERKKVTLPAEDAYELLRIRAVEDVQSEVLDRLKRRSWVVGIAVAVVGFFGINGLVTMSLYTLLRDDLREAQRASVTAADTTSEAAQAIQAAQAYVETLRRQEQEINSRNRIRSYGSSKAKQ